MTPAKQDAGALAPRSIYDVLGELARDPTVDVARIAALMDLQIKAEDRQAERLFNEAFARLQPRLPKVAKRGKIDLITREGINKGTIKFCTIEDLDAAIRPLYTEEGFTLSFMSESCPTGVMRVGILRHAAGHSIRSTMNLPPDKSGGKGELQGYGSSMSFCDRYITRGLFNIIMVDEDNDGTSGNFINQKRIDNIEDIIHECGEQVRAPFLTFVGAKAVNEIQNGGYTAAINYLVAKRRQIAEKAK